MISVIGYGSLLSEQSARETVAQLENFQLVRVPGYRRIFNKVGIVFLTRHAANPDSTEIASCSTEYSAKSQLICSHFQCSEEAFADLFEREHRFDWIEVDATAFNGEATKGMMCTSFTDEQYRYQKCSNEDEYHQRVGQYYGGRLWRDDILPFPRYLAFCLQAASSQGKEVLDNFLDHSFLADGNTTIRQYIATHPELSEWQKVECGYSYKR